MSIQQMLITTCANVLLSKSTFATIKDAVIQINMQNLTGAQKRANVLKDLEKIALNIGESMLNLGVELAVAWIKTQTK